MLEGKAHGKGLVAKLSGIDDRDQAEALAGFEIIVSRSQFPQAEVGEYYWADLEGLKVEAVDGTEEFTRCAVGLAECSDTSPCPLHDTWKPLKTRITDYMSEHTLADLATALAQKKKLNEQNPHST